ncbi:MAG: DUF2127 domain-containing protein [Candidatus Rokuibacteriota bacterium]|nr:MAG: DUF2127 domain-containing protein [Candidatus Rokubacteria bacterium]
MIRLIGILKLLKGLLLLAFATEVFRLLRRPDAADVVAGWAGALHLNTGGRMIGHLLERLGAVDEHTLRRVRVGAFVYAALLMIEGIGLLRQRRWAEYVTVIITASFIPIEVYEVARDVTWIRVAAVAVNIAIVWYLVVRLKGDA